MKMAREVSTAKSQRPVAFVTGASTGIGAEVAVAMAREGWDVAIAATAMSRLTDTAQKVKAAGAQTIGVALDLRSPASVAAAAAKVFKAFGRVDVLVNNAGVTLRQAAVDVTVAEWEGVMQTNLRGSFLLCQQVGRRWIKQGSPGNIINLASAHGVVGFPNRLVYGVSKAALIHMTRMLAIEWVEHRIRVNAVAPGTVDTPSRAKALAAPKVKKVMLARIPMHRYATAGEVADAVCFLAGPKSSYITGQTLLLDGGLTSY
jgi:NAD(P)-dependent dehydrogenase (short-subunit alcohol dehydrogenase family)